MSHVRQRLWLFVSIVIAGVVASGLLAGALAHAAAEPPAPIVTFTPLGAPPTACGTRPDVSSLSVPVGTAIVVANRTEVPASVVVNGATVLPVAPDQGASLTLTAGQHDIRLVPECESVAATMPLVVMVTANNPPPTVPAAPPTTPTAPPTTPAAPPTTPGVLEGSGPSTATGPPRRSGPAGESPAPTEPVQVSAATHVEPSGPARAPGTTAGGPGSGVLSASTVALEPQDHPKGLRLLAAIATICVLGVTAAIIRAIVRLSP